MNPRPSIGLNAADTGWLESHACDHESMGSVDRGHMCP